MRVSADAFLLGRVGYREAWAWQRAVQADLLAARREGRDARPAVLVVEHPPVFTLGASGRTAHLVGGEAAIRARGGEIVASDRGGDVTFHGPGQIVAYPVLDLERLVTPEGESLRDLHRYLRELEESILRTCAGVGVEAGRVDGRTGVWVGPDARGPERKVAAIGIRTSRWTTLHGLALNVTTDLSWFGLIVPCGIADRGVTRLADETDADLSGVAETLVGHLGDRLGLALDVHADARPALGARLALDEQQAG